MPDIIVETIYGLWFLFIWSSGFGCAFHFMNCTKPLSQNMFVLDLAAGLSFPQPAQGDVKEDGCTISPTPSPTVGLINMGSLVVVAARCSETIYCIIDQTQFFNKKS